MTDLRLLSEKISNCVRCKLSESRKQTVFGMGNENAKLMFVGEGPGEEEDKQGLPFVGKSGKLLDECIEEVFETKRDQFYIANIVKCRPPGNRDPMPDEIASCIGYLDKQIALIRPRVIVALGKVAAQSLLKTEITISHLREKSFICNGTYLVPTFHPSYVIRSGGMAKLQFKADLVRAKRLVEIAAD